jgi:hypothetical protein
MKWIPKKYMQNIIEVYKDSEGWWAYTKKGFKFAGMGCHTAHEDTQHELLKMIRTMEPCDCEQCMAPEIEEVEMIQTASDEMASATENVENEITDFNRYCELLEKVYGMKTTSTAEEKQELESLGYKLELNGVPDIISEMNFNRLQNKLEKQLENEMIELEVIEPALEIRIRDKEKNQIDTWYCQMFDSKQAYDQEVEKQFDLKKYFKDTSIFEIEHIDLKRIIQINKVFQFKHNALNQIYDCRIHPDDVAEVTWTNDNIFHSSLFSMNHLKLSIKHGDWVVVQGGEI